VRCASAGAAMSTEVFISYKPQAATLKVIEQANAII
jgi:hypothetical protein